jgi:hypothetical protein
MPKFTTNLRPRSLSHFPRLLAWLDGNVLLFDETREWLEDRERRPAVLTTPVVGEQAGRVEGATALRERGGKRLHHERASMSAAARRATVYGGAGRENSVAVGLASPLVEDCCLLAECLHDSQVVRDQQIGDGPTELRDQLEYHVAEDHVQRAGGLVPDE